VTPILASCVGEYKSTHEVEFTSGCMVCGDNMFCMVMWDTRLCMVWMCCYIIIDVYFGYDVFVFLC